MKLKPKNINKPDLTQLLKRSFTLVSPFDHYHINYSQSGLLGISRWRKCCCSQNKHLENLLELSRKKERRKEKTDWTCSSMKLWENMVIWSRCVWWKNINLKISIQWVIKKDQREDSQKDRKMNKNWCGLHGVFHREMEENQGWSTRFNWHGRVPAELCNISGPI